jgi:hypothetical protein
MKQKKRTWARGKSKAEVEKRVKEMEDRGWYPISEIKSTESGIYSRIPIWACLLEKEIEVSKKNNNFNRW